MMNILINYCVLLLIVHACIYMFVDILCSSHTVVFIGTLYLCAVCTLMLKKEYNQSDTQILFGYYSYMFQPLQHNYHQAVHQNCKNEISYVKLLVNRSQLYKCCYVFRYVCFIMVEKFNAV
jgi:hypothetical protein